VDTDELDNGFISIISFSSLYSLDIERKFLDDVVQYGLATEKITPDVKRLLHHHIIYGVCEAIKKCSTGRRCILYFCNADLLHTQTYDLFGSAIAKIFNKILKDISNKLPVRVYMTKTPFQYYVFLKTDNKNKGIEIVESLLLHASKDQSDYTFNKIKKYVSRNGLTFLNQKYFNSITNRMLLTK